MITCCLNNIQERIEIWKSILKYRGFLKFKNIGNQLTVFFFGLKVCRNFFLKFSKWNWCCMRWTMYKVITFQKLKDKQRRRKKFCYIRALVKSVGFLVYLDLSIKLDLPTLICLMHVWTNWNFWPYYTQ